MALILEKTLNNGFSGNYWRIVRINNLVKGTTQVVLGLFKDKEASDSGMDLVHAVTFDLNIPKENFVEGNVFELAYKLIKEPKLGEDGEETNEFAGAIDG